MKKLNRQIAFLPPTKPIKVLQFGGGNFLRAYANWMIDELNKETDFNGGVLVVKPTEKGDYRALREQDGLYHVLTNGYQDGELINDYQLIECVQEIVHPYQEWKAYLETAELASIRFIISNTTESGIKFSTDDQDVDKPPIEFPAKLTKWFYHRWQHFRGTADSGCVILPCELIEGNGKTLKNCVLNYADHWGLENDFKRWIEQHNHFCNTLVDRIVPGFPKGDITEFYQKIGYEDALVVDAEPYHIWVIEGPPEIQKELPFEQTKLNVVFTNDLTPYRQLKVRILNGAHTTMVPVGYLAGIETVREAVEDDEVGGFIRKALFDEILPTLEFPDAQKQKYANDVLDRFRNPYIHHRLISISLNSTSKFKTRVLPSILAYHEKFGELPQNLLSAFAALICFYRGKRGQEDIPLNDSEFALSFFRNAWKKWDKTKDTSHLVISVLSNLTLWESDLNKVTGLSEALKVLVEKQIT